MRERSNLHIDKTRATPEVDFKTDGHLSLEGRALPDYVQNFFDELFMWVEELDAPEVSFDINMDYINTNFSILLLNLLQRIEANQKVRKIVVNWFYEADDEDHYETGLFYKERLKRTRFNYLITV